ncbi:hypothetical protein G6F65_023516 [Rhizopus arrhizus]|nr:hypothetical protein G6F65_023516 [Rhizopus arrhizus]
MWVRRSMPSSGRAAGAATRLTAMPCSSAGWLPLPGVWNEKLRRSRRSSLATDCTGAGAATAASAASPR